MLSPRSYLDVLDLLANYSRSYDAKDIDSFVHSFAPEGRLVRRDGISSGHQEIREWVLGRTNVAAWREPGAPEIHLSARHFVSAKLAMSI